MMPFPPFGAGRRRSSSPFICTVVCLWSIAFLRTVLGGGVPCATVAWIDPPAHAIPASAQTGSPLTVRMGLSTRVYTVDPSISLAMEHAGASQVSEFGDVSGAGATFADEMNPGDLLQWSSLRTSLGLPHAISLVDTSADAAVTAPISLSATLEIDAGTGQPVTVLTAVFPSGWKGQGWPTRVSLAGHAFSGLRPPFRTSDVMHTVSPAMYYTAPAQVDMCVHAAEPPPPAPTNGSVPVVTCGSGFDARNGDPEVDGAHGTLETAPEEGSAANDLVSRGGSIGAAIVDWAAPGAAGSPTSTTPHLAVRVSIPRSGSALVDIDALNLTVTVPTSSSSPGGSGSGSGSGVDVYRVRSIPGVVGRGATLSIAKLDPVVTLSVASAEREVYAGALEVRGGFGDPPSSTAQISLGEPQPASTDDVRNFLLLVVDGAFECRQVPAVPTPDDFQAWQYPNGSGHPPIVDLMQVATPEIAVTRAPAGNGTLVLVLSYPGDPDNPAVVLTYTPSGTGTGVWGKITRVTRGYTCPACSLANSEEGCRWCDWMHYALHRDVDRPYRVLTIPGRHQLGEHMGIDNRLSATLISTAAAADSTPAALRASIVEVEGPEMPVVRMTPPPETDPADTSSSSSPSLSTAVYLTATGLERTDVHAATTFPTYDVLVPGMPRFGAADDQSPVASAPPSEWLWTEPGTIGEHCGQLGLAHAAFHFAGCGDSPRGACVADVGAIRSRHLGSHPFPFDDRLRGSLHDTATGATRQRSRIARQQQPVNASASAPNTPAPAASGLAVQLEYAPVPVVASLMVPIGAVEFREPYLDACTLTLSPAGSFASMLNATVRFTNTGDERAPGASVVVTCGVGGGSGPVVRSDPASTPGGPIGESATGSVMIGDVFALPGSDAVSSSPALVVECVAAVSIETKTHWSTLRKSAACSASIETVHGRFADPCDLDFPEPAITVAVVGKKDGADDGQIFDTVELTNTGARDGTVIASVACHHIHHHQSTTGSVDGGNNITTAPATTIEISVPASGSPVTIDTSYEVSRAANAALGVGDSNSGSSKNTAIVTCTVDVTVINDPTECWSERGRRGGSANVTYRIAGDGSSETQPSPTATTNPWGSPGTPNPNGTLVPASESPGIRQVASGARGGDDTTDRSNDTWLGSMARTDMILYSAAMAAGAVVIICGAFLAARQQFPSNEGEEEGIDGEQSTAHLAEMGEAGNGAEDGEEVGEPAMYMVDIPLPPRESVYGGVDG